MGDTIYGTWDRNLGKYDGRPNTASMHPRPIEPSHCHDGFGERYCRAYPR